MEKYRITVKKSVTEDFRTIPKSDIKKILAKIDPLAENPRRDGTIKLGGQDLYRIRQGLYRIIYEIRENELAVQVIKVGHRSDVYKRT
ncbi:type II toxin-antitoxin system RelE family toxin [Alteromonas ponticola]|uniref:Type II toxin-antitoxin system RelE/ParE family toxin n=1 Tax=Alteromonas ponticola TaxID=2720613 RepID=A0ABX1R4Z1_9ALTE|nr:type II toxin-antitoxin system RelE/ParE family toxin [Alteromonas ponticola]NMH60328.1 type II toxin-antitoxin system RelE/ParE family toxin [Alteromonas ponticola]